jgi:outer membrane protein assembly factor BamB
MPVSASPAVAGGYVLVGGENGVFYCLNASDGALVWYVPTLSVVTSSAYVEGGAVYFGSADGWLYCVELASGMPLWRVSVGGEVSSSPTVSEGRVFVGSGSHDLKCFNATDGTPLWSFPTQYAVESSPAVCDGVVYFASYFHVYALNASTGTKLWSQHTGSAISSPAVSEGCLYIGSYDGYICCLNASDGNKIWQTLTADAVNSSPAVAYGCVYVGSEDNNVYCLNASDGQIIWQTPTGYWVRSSPAVAAGNVYVGSEDYCLYCLNAQTGQIKWRYQTGNMVDSSPALADDTLFFGSADGDIYAFALSSSAPQSVPQPIPMPFGTVIFNFSAGILAALIVTGAFLYRRSNKKDIPNSPHTTNQKNWRLWVSQHLDALCILAILAFSAGFFVNLADGPLWAADEQTYSQWAYHMVRSGDYLTPHAFGSMALWIGKPPLYMWLMSLAYQAFGVSNFTTRLWSPIFATMLLVAMFYLGKILYNRAVGLVSALVLGLFATFYSFAQHAMTDVPFVFFLVASIYFFIQSQTRQNTRWQPVLGGLFFGLALMTKQLEALLIPIILLIYLILTQHNLKSLFSRQVAVFLGVGILVTAPYLLYMFARFGMDFYDWYVVYSTVTRTVTPIEGHAAGYLFYFEYLLSKETLWALLLPFAGCLCLYHATFKRSKADVLLLVWMAVVVLVFTFAQTKLEWYLLPALPAFALAIGALLYKIGKKIWRHKRR